MSCDIHSTTCDLYSVTGNRLIEQCFKVLNPLLIASVLLSRYVCVFVQDSCQQFVQSALFNTPNSD